MTRRRRLILAGVVLAGLGALLLARHRISAALTLLDVVGAPRPFAPEVEPGLTDVGGVGGLLYDGRGPAILIVPGAVPAGFDDARVRIVARALSRAGRTVFVPELDLYDEQFTMADLDRITRAVRGLAKLTDGEVTAAGFSYGGSFALVAAANPEMEGRLSRVATFGAYYDLEGVVQAVTTGGSLVDGEFLPWQGHPRAKTILADRTVELLKPSVHEPLHAALDGQIDPGTLPDDARSLFDLLVNEDPARTAELIGGLPPVLRSLIDTFSPSEVAEEVDVPVLAMHSTDDPIVPYAELIRIEDALPEAETLTVEIFRHVDFDPTSSGNWWSLVRDVWAVWDFATWILDG